MPALQHFFDAERQRRGWSMKEAAERSRISLSKAYAITNGDDNVEFQTFENIAAAFGMTPADLAVVIGKGSADHDPDEAHVIALFRQVPEEKRLVATDLLRVLATKPTQRAKSRTDGTAKRLEQRRRELLNGTDGIEERTPKRRQLSIRKVSTLPEHWLHTVLVALGLNRDSGQFSPAT